MSATKARRRRSARVERPAWQKAVAGLVVGFGILLGVESALRLAGVAPAYSAEAIAGWRVARNLDASEIKGPRDGHPFVVSTNDAGLRTGLSRARSPGVKRVAVMGDSTVFGWGVDDGGTVAEGLEQELAEAHPELGVVEVLNAGQPGYSTTQASWLLREVVAEWTPDLVVHFLPLHDGNLVLVSDREVLRGGDGLGSSLRIGLARHSRLYASLRQVLFQQANEASVVPQRAADSEPRVPRVSDEERALAVQDMVDAASGWGGTVALGLLPFQGDLVTHSPTDRPSAAWARAYGEDASMELVDARACCGPDGGGLVLPDDPGHLTAEGNLRVGASMADTVADLLGGS